jgi:tetratricopeptide (TPR) repeat protein
MESQLFFISMEGRTNYKIGNFTVREDIPLPILIPEGEKFAQEHIVPDNIIAGMIRILMENNESDHLEYYREFIFSLQPEIEKRLSTVGYEAEKNQHFQDAIDIFKVLLALKPESLNSNLNLAVCYDEFSQYLFEHGRETEALKMEELSFDFFKIVESFREMPDSAYYYLGRFYLYRENYDKSISYFDEFVLMTGDADRKKEVIELLQNINNQGVIDDDYKYALELLHADKDQAALESINRYLEKFKNSWQGYYVKGCALRKLAEYDEAIEILEKALHFNPDSSDIYNELGLSYMNKGIYYKGEQSFYNALKKSPEDLAILTNLAMLYFKKGDKKEAVKYCDIILEFDPNDLYAKDLRKLIEES